jgi:hypothetical protein
MKPNLKKSPSWIIIIRCIHERGQSQQDALVELRRRGLWLAEEQARQAGITREQAGLGPETQFRKYARKRRRWPKNKSVRAISGGLPSLGKKRP